MRKVLILVGTGVVLVVLAIAATTALQKHTQQSAAKKLSDTFISDILNDKPSDSYELFTSVTQQNITQNDWQAQVDKLSAFFAHSTATYKSNTVSGQYQYLDYTINGADGKYTFSVIATDNAKKWQVQSFISQVQR